MTELRRYGLCRPKGVGWCESVARAASAEFRHVELRLDGADDVAPPAGETPAQVRAVADRAGVSLSVHAPSGLNLGEKVGRIRRESESIFLETLELASSLGARWVTTHLGSCSLSQRGPRRDTRLEYAAGAVASLLKRSDTLGIDLAVENLPVRPAVAERSYLGDSLADFQALFARVDHPRLKVIFDVGHALIRSDAYAALSLLKNLGERVVGFHVHQNDGQRDEHECLSPSGVSQPGYVELCREVCELADRRDAAIVFELRDLDAAVESRRLWNMVAKRPDSEVPSDWYLGTTWLGDEEEQSVLDVIRARSLFRYEGPNLLRVAEKFEQLFAQVTEAENVRAVNSGTAALEMGLRALGVGPGDEVLVPAFTFAATANVVLNVGAIPIFVNVDDALNISVDDAERRVTSRTRAVIAVHMRGVPCDMERVVEFSSLHGLALIEDCAQAFGAKYQGKPVGTFGDAAAYSLQSHKVITTGEGGVFTSRERAVFRAADRFHDNGCVRTDGTTPCWTDAASGPGANFKISELSAAVGLAQLRRTHEILARQRATYEDLSDGLAPEVELRPMPPGAQQVPVTLAVRLATPDQRAEFLSFMADAGIRMGALDSWFLPSFTALRRADPEAQERCAPTLDLLTRYAWFPLSASLRAGHVAHVRSWLNRWAARQVEA